MVRLALAARLQRHWWRADVSLPMQLLRPLSWLYAALARRMHQPAQALPVPVVVVGNLIVGGAGKTPTVLAVVQGLQQAGWFPGIVSRGHGRRGDGVQAVQAGSAAAAVGDEPLLLRRRSGVPVWVGRRRVDAARALLAAHAEVDVLVSDDGLQHRALPRVAEIMVFDERGCGNGLLLPAGPLREALPRTLAAQQLLLYNAARPSTPLPGAFVQRRLAQALPLADWQAGRTEAAVPLDTLRGRPLLAAAGIAAPERFFAMLEAQGLQIERLPLPDHHGYATLPWPAATADVVVTEKDAVKLTGQLTAPGATRIWVVGLDFALPAEFTQDLLRRLGQPPHLPKSPTPP